MSNVKVDENSLSQANVFLTSIASSLSNLSGNVAAIDLSDIELGMDLSNTVSLIKNVISSPYSDSSISALRKNIEYTRNALIKMNSEIGTVFDGLDEIEDFGNFTDYVGSIKIKQNSVDLETYLNTLKSQGFKVEKIPNGGYKVTTSYSCVFYLSDDCTYNDVQVISYYPGQGDVYGDTALLRSKLENNGVPSGTIAMVSFLPGTWENQETNNSAYDILERMEEDANIDVTSVVSMGFSLGGFKSFTRLNDYLKTHPNIKGEDCAVICIDGITNNTKGWIEADMLAERNVPAYLIRSAQYESFAQNPGSGHDNCKMLTEMGLNTYLILDNVRNGHMNTNEAVLSNGLYEFLGGKVVDFEGKNDYTVYRYGNGQSTMTSVPNYYMQDYNTVFGGGTVANNGCGPTAIAMVLSSLLNKKILPSEIAEKYSSRFGLEHGADWGIITKVPLDYGIDAPLYVNYDFPERWNEMVAALKRGAVIVTEASGQGAGAGNSPFTDGKHFIVLTGITEDGKIMVNDPNKLNYNEFRDEKWGPTKEVLSDGFANGFPQSVFKCGDYTAFWVFERTDATASNGRSLVSIDSIRSYSSADDVKKVSNKNYKLGGLYDQMDEKYKEIRYSGYSNLYKSGCGFFSVLNCITAKTGHVFNYDEIKTLAGQVEAGAAGGTNVDRMEWLLEHLSKEYDFTWDRGPKENLINALSEGKTAISLVPTRTSDSGHILALTGVLDNGRVVVADSYADDAIRRGDTTGYYDGSAASFAECMKKTGFAVADFATQKGGLKLSPSWAGKNENGEWQDFWYITFNDDSLNFNNEPTFSTQESTTSSQGFATSSQGTTASTQASSSSVQGVTSSTNSTVNEPTVNKPEVEQIVSEQNTHQNDSRPVINVEESKVVEDKNETVVEEEIIIEEEPIIKEEAPIEDNNIPSNNDEGIIVPEASNSGGAKKFILPGILGAGLAALAAKLGIDFNKKRKDNDEL